MTRVLVVWETGVDDIVYFFITPNDQVDRRRMLAAHNCLHGEYEGMDEEERTQRDKANYLFDRLEGPDVVEVDGPVLIEGESITIISSGEK